MLSLLDIAERSQRGPKVEEKAWDMGLFRKMGELVAKYEIAYPDDGSFTNSDDALADRAFEAALEFLADVGIYCITTGRVIQFGRDELAEAVKEIPGEVIVGEGRDARVIRQIALGEREHIGQCPGHHAPFSEEYAPLVVKNFAQIPSGDYLEGINFDRVDGREVFGVPMEAYAARRELAWLREGVRKAGRPGMAVAYYPISTRSAVLIAPMDPVYGLRRTDGILLSVLPDVKVEHDLLTAAIVYQDYGCFKVNGGGSGLVGGFCGGPEGAVIESLVKSLGGFLVYRDTLCNTGVGRLATTTSRTMSLDPQTSWAGSVVFQALHRHTKTVCFGGAGNAAGPGTETHLWELAFGAIRAPVNGYNLYIPRQGRARMNASQTPLEAEWVYEVATAAMRSGLEGGRSEDLLRKVAAEVEGRAVEDPVHISECYDLVHHRPSPEYERIYLGVKEELASMGLAFD
ncbi:MAG: monomethylamine:corrinoid methyltransferase [Gemmatimonadetes bacterium]|nr:monomethylamine:corrinoid methyltransferase [Gemmatimonadota bacterium]